MTEMNEWRDARRAQMAAQPRCDVPKCGRRGAMRAMGVLLCKGHFTRANRAYLRRMAANPVGLFLAVTYPPEQFIAMAEVGAIRRSKAGAK